ncbi:protein adenylyltransferase SelO family protein [Thiothrix fructosivorans]|uniref:YdiU family protein n=1 Tax=Thiothrix fructosivorans TaxID=111770 RepID=A0A8B0SM29_9GAMM|nr:protein adenylyltransferase SelO family protein [Thiothrix fructosivorans]MBO0612396.1 YdiU family protein [Thiothrix fructosivorans]QTX12121.1 YdiU family protein [Thiothrix fructosivorans]
MKHLTDLSFHNRFHALGSHFYSECPPQGLENPTLVCSSPEVLQCVGLPPDEANTDLFLQVFSGNALLPGMQPLAQDYAGHQFGNFNPFLGDGRALLLGEVATPTDILDIYLKGAGKTPYARNADGRAGLRECLHEFDTTTQLAALGVPTARCLCVASGSQLVYRAGFEPSAIVTRIAPSHIRFGTFENYFFQKNHAALRQLTEHVIACHYPTCLEAGENRYAAFFREVVLRTARLIAHWQAVGFTHGVMNTDNQSILGITLDVGASSFTPDHDPNYVTHPADEHKRYAFGQQPVVGLWNCNVLARALSPLIAAQDLRQALLAYEREYLRKSKIFVTMSV